MKKCLHNEYYFIFELLFLLNLPSNPLIFSIQYFLLAKVYIFWISKRRDMNLSQIKSIFASHRQELKERYKVAEIGIFGSYVRGEQEEGSDLDVLVEFEGSIGLFKFVELENYLSEILGTKVDLVMRGGLKPRIGKHILREVIMV
jgi:hypothetical protein